jgi:membrane protein
MEYDQVCDRIADQEMVPGSVTIDEMTISNLGVSGDPQPKNPVSPPPASSTINVTNVLKSNGTADLHSTPLRPGTAAQRLLAEDDSRELFQHLPETYSLSHRLRRHGWSTLRYLMQTEVHTYAFSVAANSILSIFPFLVLLLTVVHRVLHSQAMYNVVLELLRVYLPSNKDFVIRNLQFLESVKGRGQILSFVMLLITSTGIFLPLEVALNSVWGFKKNRSYLMNLVVSLGLALGCGCLAMLSIALTAQNLRMLGLVIGDGDFVFQGLGFIVMKASAILATIGIYFLIYWILPNGKVPARAVLPAAIITGLVSEGAKYLYIHALPWLNFQEVYGPFSVSVTLIFWSFWNGMLLLGGAYLSAAEHSSRVQARRDTAAAK